MLLIIITSILLSIGITFYFLFRSFKPIYIDYRAFRKVDWRVNIDKNKPKNKDAFDVIIVGSGIGGLSCGSILAAKGYKVLVLEQAQNLGGYFASFKRKGFLFNVGVEDVSGLWVENGTLSYFMKMTGLKKEDHFIENRERQYYANGMSITLDDKSKHITHILSALFPEEKNIARFFADAKKAYEEFFSNNKEYGIPLSPELIVRVFGLKKLLRFPKEKPNFYKWATKNFRQKLDEYFKDEKLIDFVSTLTHYIDAPLEKVPGGTAIVACLSYLIYGGGYLPKNAGASFTEALREVIEKNGGSVLVSHKVDKISIVNGAVNGVRANGKFFSAPIVVSNANALHTYFDLVGTAQLDKKFTDSIKSLNLSTSVFAAYLGVDMDLRKYPAIIANKDERFGFAITSNIDPVRAPKGQACVSIIEKDIAAHFPEYNTAAYAEKKSQKLNELIDKVERIIPSFREHIVVQDTATPRTLERYTSMPEGALYCFEQSSNIKRPSFKSPIKGLYLSSASTGHGGGIESVVMTGIICSHDINNWGK